MNNFSIHQLNTPQQQQQPAIIMLNLYILSASNIRATIVPVHMSWKGECIARLNPHTRTNTQGPSWGAMLKRGHEVLMKRGHWFWQWRLSCFGGLLGSDPIRHRSSRNQPCVHWIFRYFTSRRKKTANWNLQTRLPYMGTVALVDN